MYVTNIIRTLLISITSLFIIACSQNETPSSQADLNSAIQEEISFLIGHDVSGTFEDHEKIQLHQLADILQPSEQVGATFHLAFGPIGNPTIQPLSRFHLKAVPPLVSTPNIRIARWRKEKRDSILRENQLVMDKIQLAFERRILSAPLSDSTAINQFLKTSKTYFSEPQKDQHQKFLLLYTDGEEDINPHKLERVNPQLIRDLENVTVILIGWSIPKNCDCPNALEIESVDGFIQYFKYQFQNKIAKHE